MTNAPGHEKGDWVLVTFAILPGGNGEILYPAIIEYVDRTDEGNFYLVRPLLGFNFSLSTGIKTVSEDMIH